MTAERSHKVVGDFLDRAALRGERVVALVRLLLCALFLGQYLFLSQALGRSTTSISYVTSVAAFVLGIGYSGWVLRSLRVTPRLRLHLTASVLLGALIIALALVPYALYSPSSYSGFLREGNTAVLIIGCITPGVRLVRSLSLLGSALMVVLSGLLLGLDYTQNVGLLLYGTADVVNFSFYLAGAALLGYTVASRTKRLVYEGAGAAVDGERARQRLGIYVSEEVANEAMRRTSLQLGGDRRVAAVLFSDLRGFTGYAEHLSPEATVAELNAYLDAMVKVVRRNGGVVDKFMGDAIMVSFGVAEPRPNDAARAIKTAAEMCRALETHNLKRAKDGRPPFAHGVGVHFGTVVAGNVGNRDRLQFTVIGDTVNLASRLEAATKELAQPVVISAEAVEAARAGPGASSLPALRSLGEIQVPGRAAGLEVYTLAAQEGEPGTQ